jgi:hypothetical protein
VKRKKLPLVSQATLTSIFSLGHDMCTTLLTEFLQFLRNRIVITLVVRCCLNSLIAMSTAPIGKGGFSTRHINNFKTKAKAF